MKEQSVAKGFAVLSVAGIVVKILSLLYIPFLLAIIGDEGYGIYVAAYQVYVLVYVLANSGIPVAISKLVSELLAVGNHRDAVRSFKIARFMLLILGTVMSLLLLAFAGPVSRAMHFEKSYLAIFALSPTLLFTAVASAYRGYFQGRGNMTPTAVSQIIEQVANTIFTLVFAGILIRYGVEKACAGGTIGTSLGALFAAVFLLMFHHRNDGYALPKPSGDIQVKRYTYSQLVKKVVNYSVPITLCVGMQYAGNLVDIWNTKVRLLAAGFTDTRATELYSHLNKCLQLMNAPIAIAAALAAAILPAISGAVALNNRKRVQNRVDFAFRLCFLVTIPSAVGFAVLSGPVFGLLKYGEGAYLLKYGSVYLVLLSIVQVQTSILQGAGRLYPVTFFLVLGILGKIATNYFLIAVPRINIAGAIIGSIVGFCIPIFFNTLQMKKALKVKFHASALFIKPAVASGLMGLVVYFTYKILAAILVVLRNAYLINAAAAMASIFIGGAAYFMFLVLFRGITKEDLDILPQRFLRLIPGAMLRRIR